MKQAIAGFAILAVATLGTATPAAGQVQPFSATLAVAQNPNPAPPTSTNEMRIDFTSPPGGDQPGTVTVSVSLFNTDGQGTLSLISGGAPLTGCGVDSSGRVVSCSWEVNTPSETVPLAFRVNVGAGATPPDWQIRATVLGPNDVSPALLLTVPFVIQAPATTTTTTTTTTTAPPTTTTAPATTTPGAIVTTTAAPATGAPGGGSTGAGLPATGSTDKPLALAAFAAIAVGGSLVLLARRRSPSQRR